MQIVSIDSRSRLASQGCQDFAFNQNRQRRIATMVLDDTGQGKSKEAKVVAYEALAAMGPRVADDSCNTEANPGLRNVHIVFHDSTAEVKILETMHQVIFQLGQVVSVNDTQRLFADRFEFNVKRTRK